MSVTTDKTVRELAIEIPAATRVFEKMGVDYCCGGSRSLADACAIAGVKVEEVQMELAAATYRSDEIDFQSASLEELINHIVGKHHCFTRLEIARLNALFQRVCDAHGTNHPELMEIQALFRELGYELETHMGKEERVLFPYVIGLEASSKKLAPLFHAPFGTVANPVRMMMMEHEQAGELLKKMRKLSGDYAIPADACLSYKTLYEAVEELEKDLHQHIHLENNILFPKAIEMETTAEANS